MQGCLAIAVGLIDVGTLLYQSFDKPDLKLNHSKMQRTAVDSATHVDINLLAIDQYLSSCKLFVTDSEAKWRAVVFIEDVGVSIAL